jgi:hypothetical protein
MSTTEIVFKVKDNISIFDIEKNKKNVFKLKIENGG